jgi:hypothetical protein
MISIPLKMLMKAMESRRRGGVEILPVVLEKRNA